MCACFATCMPSLTQQRMHRFLCLFIVYAHGTVCSISLSLCFTGLFVYILCLCVTSFHFFMCNMYSFSVIYLCDHFLCYCVPDSVPLLYLCLTHLAVRLLLCLLYWMMLPLLPQPNLQRVPSLLLPLPFVLIRTLVIGSIPLLRATLNITFHILLSLSGFWPSPLHYIFPLLINIYHDVCVFRSSRGCFHAPVSLSLTVVSRGK